MRILSLSNCPLERQLGSGKTVLMWSEGLRARGHQVTVFPPSDFEPWPTVQTARKFRQAIGAWRRLDGMELTEFDLIEFYGDEFWLATWWLSQRCPRPFLVAHTNGLELLATERAQASPGGLKVPSTLRQAFSKLTHERFSPIAFRRADAFVTLCELDRDYVVNHGIQRPDRTAVVPPGVDDEFLSILKEQAPERRILFFGSWTPRKGLSEVRIVMIDALKKHLDITFEIIGASGSAAVILQSFPPELHPRITIHPRLSNSEVAQVLARCAILFFPSQYEGFGMAVAEAMASGCAAVTTPTGFGGELRDGVEALICPFGDVIAMRNAIERLLDDDDFRVAIATAGQQRARTLRWETSIAKLEETYLGWIDEKKRADAA
jgi:glycosyltransferase involved in cell wall biosynthesis